MAATTWDSSFISPPATLANTNTRLLKGAGAGTYASTRTKDPLAGNVYFSVAIRTDAAGAVAGAGVVDETVDLTNPAVWAGSSLSAALWGPNGIGYVAGTSVLTQAFTSNPQTLEIAVRVSSRRVWVRRPGQPWIQGGDPVADTTPTFIVGGTSDLYVGASLSTGGATANRYVDLFADPAFVTGVPPVGFTVGLSDGSVSISQEINLELDVAQSLVLLPVYKVEQEITLTVIPVLSLFPAVPFFQEIKLTPNVNSSLVQTIPGYETPVELFLEASPIKEFALAFDQLGRPLIFYRVATDTLRLYWFDPFLNQTVKTDLTTGVNPVAGFDYPQDSGEVFTDILLFYVRNNVLYMREQRDRFLVEYNTGVSHVDLKIESCGLRKDYKYQVIYNYPEN